MDKAALNPPKDGVVRKLMRGIETAGCKSDTDQLYLRPLSFFPSGLLMTSIVRSVFSAAHRERPIAWRELFSPAFVESLDLAAVVSVFTAGLALVSAVALTFLGGV